MGFMLAGISYFLVVENMLLHVGGVRANLVDYDQYFNYGQFNIIVWSTGYGGRMGVYGAAAI